MVFSPQGFGGGPNLDRLSTLTLGRHFMPSLLSPILQRFAEQFPIPTMARAVLERCEPGATGRLVRDGG